MSRQARWIECVAVNAAVPLMAIRASMALTQSSTEHAQSRIVRARKAKEGGEEPAARALGAACPGRARDTMLIAAGSAPKFCLPAWGRCMNLSAFQPDLQGRQ